MHLPSWAASEWLKQLTAEQMVTVKNKRGFAKLELAEAAQAQRSAGLPGLCPRGGMERRCGPLVGRAVAGVGTAVCGGS